MTLNSVILLNSMLSLIGLLNRHNLLLLKSKWWHKRDMEHHKKPKNKKHTLDMYLMVEMFQMHMKSMRSVLNLLHQLLTLHLSHMVRAEIILVFLKRFKSILCVDKSWTKQSDKRWHPNLFNENSTCLTKIKGIF